MNTNQQPPANDQEIDLAVWESLLRGESVSDAQVNQKTRREIAALRDAILWRMAGENEPIATDDLATQKAWLAFQERLRRDKEKKQLSSLLGGISS